MTATAANPKTGPTRLHGLDALRAGALFLGIVLHTLMPFMPGIGAGWIVVDSRSSEGATIMVSWIHLFRMVLFMMLAGYFGRMVLQRRGAGSYVKDRALRILLPLLVFWPILIIGLAATGVLNSSLRNAPALASPTGEAELPLWMLFASPGHLWFLGVLVQCVVITVVLRAIGVRLFGKERLAGWAQRAGNWLAAPFGVLLAAIPYLLALVLQGAAGGGIAQPITIVPELPSTVGYLGAFLVGWYLHASTDGLARLTRQWPLQLGAALVLTVVGYFIPNGAIPLVAHAAIVGVSGWCWVFGLTGLCTRFLRNESHTVRYLADSSYWIYLMHLPLMPLIQIFLADLDLPILVKLLITWVVGFSLLLLSYDLLVRRTWLGKWLNGHRRKPILLPAKPEKPKKQQTQPVQQDRPVEEPVLPQGTPEPATKPIPRQ